MDVLQHAPALTRDEAESLARRLYGLEADTSPLPSERDQNNRMRERGILLGTDGPLANVLEIRPPMPFTRENAAHLAATLDNVVGALAR